MEERRPIDEDRTPLLTSFVDGPALLEQAVGAIAGKDPELRLLALRLPPYGDLQILDPGDTPSLSGKVVDALRGQGPPDDKACAGGYDLARLLLRLLGPTLLRQKVRLLMANRLLQGAAPEIDNCFENDASTEAARRRAASLVKRRLERLSIGATEQEQSALRQRGEGAVLAAQQRWQATHQDADPEDEAENSAAIDDLSDHERRNGALVATISVRSGLRRDDVESRLMPDPDQPDRMLMADRDQDSRRLVPQLRRRRKRYVEQQPDGGWQTLTG
ncbi:MAG TPA: hypothetical protein QGF95_19725 [Candidatus Latescibacteria bacterium]|nr:hypothetical protein [Candidatus Latescibacterota bacterium]